MNTMLSMKNIVQMIDEFNSTKNDFDIDAGNKDWNEENNFDIKEDWHQLNKMGHLKYGKEVVVEV